MNRLSFLRSQLWLWHDPMASRDPSLWPPQHDRNVHQPRLILNDAFCCFHVEGNVVSSLLTGSCFGIHDIPFDLSFFETHALL